MDLNPSTTAPTKVFINNHIIHGPKSPLPPTTSDLFAHSKNLMTFLADNLTHNNPFEVPNFVFQQFFKKFEARFLENPEHLTSLLKTEQTLSCLSGVSPIHEHKILFDLIPEVCFQDQISHVILLLSKTIDPKQAANYRNFKAIDFLAPFLRYLSKIDSDFVKLLVMDLEEAKTLLKQTIKTLRELLAPMENSLTLLPKEESADDFKALLETITQFKDQAIQQKSLLDTKFYYVLGHCSFILHLTNSVLKQDPVFLRILILSSLFYSAVEQIFGTGASTNYFFVLEKITIKPLFWLQALSSTDSRVLQSLDCLFTVIQTFHQDFSKLIEEQNSDLQSVILTLLQTLEENKKKLMQTDCLLYDYFPNQYDFLIHGTLSLVSFFINQALSLVSLFDTKPPLPPIDLLKEYIQQKLLPTTESLSPVTVTKCYSFLETKEFNNEKLSEKLFDPSNPIPEIYLNYIFRNVVLNIDQFTPETIEQIYQTYLSKTDNIKIGVFLLNLLKTPKVQLNETTKSSFINAFLDSLTTSAELWDIIQIQKDFWTLLSTIRDPVPSMEKLLPLLERSATSPTPIQIETFPKTISFTTPKTQKLLFKVILTSLESTHANITTVWGQKMDSSSTSTKIQFIYQEFTRLSLFTLPLISYLMSLLDLQAKFNLQKLYVLQIKLTSIFYHPALLLYLNSESHTQLLEAIKKLMEPRPIPQYILNQAFYENLGDFLSQALKELDDGNESFSLVTSLEFSRESFAKFQAQFLEGKITSKPFIMLQAALFTLNQQQNIFTIHSKNPACPLDEKYQNLLVSVIKKTRTSLFKFLAKIISLIALENGPADESEADLAKRITSNQDFLKTLVPSIQGIVSVFANVEKAQTAIEEIFTDFINQVLENNQGKSSYSYSLKIIGGMLEKISTLVSGKVLLNKTLVKTLIETFGFHMEQKQAFETLSSKQKLIHKNNIDYIEEFLQPLCNSFTASLSNKNQNWLEKFPNYSLDPLVETLLNEIIQGLDSFDHLKVQPPNDSFAKILSIFEIFSIHYLKSKPQEEQSDPTIDKVFSKVGIFLSMHPFKALLETNHPKIKEVKSNSLRDLFNSVSESTFALIQQENLCSDQDLSRIFPTPSSTIDSSLPSVISTLLSKFNLLENLFKNLNQAFTFPHHFIVGIYQTSLFIMNKLTSASSITSELLADLKNFLPFVSRILLSSLMSPEACTEDLWNTLNISIYQWVTQLWTLQKTHNLSFSNNIMHPLLAFIQIGLYIQPQQIQPLIFDSNPIFYEMLSSDSFPKDQVAENIIFNIFDFFFQEDSLPANVRLELAMKRRIFSFRPTQVSPLNSVEKELPGTLVDSKTLSSVLSEHFVLFHTDTFDPLTITSSNIKSVCLKIKPESAQDPESEVQRILKSISPRSAKMLDIIMSNILESHLRNLAEAATEGDFLQKRKEASLVFRTLTSLLHKHRHLVLYTIYQEKDYRSLLQRYQGKVYFIPEGDLEGEYQSISFLDALHRTRFLIYKPGHTILLFKALTFSEIGVAFQDPSNVMPFRDISTIIGKNLFGFLSRLLKDLPKQETKVEHLETGMTYYMVLAGFLALYESFTLQYNQDELNIYFRENFEEFMNGILTTFALFKDNDSYLGASIIKCLNIINTQILSNKFTHDLAKRALSAAQFEDFKLKNFEECLQVQPETSIKCPALTTLKNNKDLAEEKETIVSVSLSGRCEFPNKFDTRNYIYPGFRWSRFTSETAAYVTEINNRNNSPQEQETPLFSNLLLNLDRSDYDLGKTTENKTYVLDSLNDRFRFTLHEKYSPDKPEEDFNNLIEELKLQAVSQKPPISEPQIASYPEETKHSDVHQPRSVLWLHYFEAAETITEEEFNNKQRAIRGELKRIHEKVYSSHISFGNNEKETEQMITDEILEKIAKSSNIFEKSLTYICIADFNTLKNFLYPPEYPDIQREYARIREDFSVYLEKLRDRNYDNVQIDDRKLIPTEFRFCTDNDQYTIPTTEEEAPAPQNELFNNNDKEKYLEICKTFYHFNDEAIKGLISMFYINPIPHSDFFNFLEGACIYPQVAVKILDYILTFIYCKIPLVQNDPLYKETDPNKVFELVSQKMLSILGKFMKQNISLLFQPRSILEEYGLKQSLEKIKLEQAYLTKTQGAITCFDLIIGLLSDTQIKENVDFIRELDAIIKAEKDLRINEDDVTIPREKGVKEITVQSLKLYMKEKTAKELSHKDFARFTVYNYKRFIQETAETISTLTKQLEEVVPKVKSALLNQESDKVQLEIQNLFHHCPELKNLDSLSSFFSSSFSVWILSKNKKSTFKTQIPEEVNTKMLKTLSEQILQEKLFEDFMIHLLELSSTLLDESLKDLTDIKELLDYFLRICLHFYAILIIRKSVQVQEVSQKTEEENMTGMTLPSLSNVMSTESTHDLENLPKVTYTFSEVKRSRQFDMEILMTDIFRKYSSKMSRIIYKEENDDQGNTVLSDEIYIVCKTLPFIISFKDKKDNLMEQFTNEKYKLEIQDEYRQIEIDRENILETSLAGFTNKTQKEIKQTLEIKYLEEEGFDGGGLSREWFILISKEIFDPKFGLFRYSTNHMSIQPSPSSKLIPSHLKYMEFAGILVAKAIRDEAIIDVTFTKSFLKHILRRNIAFNDLEDVDLDLSKNLKWMLENSVEGLEQCFTYETELMGQYHTIELVPDGYDFMVTDSNKKDYMRKICENKMKNEIAQELAAFMKGFDLLISPQQIALFSPSELQLLISGSPTINVADIKQYASYNGGFNAQSDQIVWLWEILESFSQKELGAFVYFTSGSPKIRCESLATNPFCFRKVTIDVASLPVAHTCYIELEIPLYTTKEELKQKLLLAIFEGQESFQLY